MYYGLFDTLCQKEESIIYKGLKISGDVPVYRFYYLARMYITEIVSTQVRPLEIY